MTNIAKGFALIVVCVAIICGVVQGLDYLWDMRRSVLRVINTETGEMQISHSRMTEKSCAAYKRRREWELSMEYPAKPLAFECLTIPEDRQ